MVAYVKGSISRTIPINDENGDTGVEFMKLGYKMTLPQELIIEAQEIAIKTSEHYRILSRIFKFKTPYGQNTVHSHFIGKIGELGAALLFEKLGLNVQKHFLDVKNDALADMSINDVRIEVKCWNPRAYRTFGACISEAQSLKIIDKCDIILYCTYDESDGSFILRGWNKTRDIQYSPIETTSSVFKPSRKVLNRIMEPRGIKKLPNILKDNISSNEQVIA